MLGSTTGVRKRRRAPDADAALRGFLNGDEPISPAAWVKNAELVRALVAYLRAGRAFRRGGLPAALAAVPPEPAHRPARAEVSRTVVFCARSAGWRLLGLARTIAGRHLCLHESLGLCAGLRSLGFPAQVVIGYPVIELPDGKDELHAWTALDAEPINGASIAGPTNYVELVRLPRAADSSLDDQNRSLINA